MPSLRSPGTHIAHTLHATIHALPPSFRFIPIVIE
jgi:hypothetical protein